jgi:hypothetical protein
MGLRKNGDALRWGFRASPVALPNLDPVQDRIGGRRQKNRLWGEPVSSRNPQIGPQITNSKFKQHRNMAGRTADRRSLYAITNSQGISTVTNQSLDDPIIANRCKSS